MRPFGGTKTGSMGHSSCAVVGSLTGIFGIALQWTIASRRSGNQLNPQVTLGTRAKELLERRGAPLLRDQLAKRNARSRPDLTAVHGLERCVLFDGFFVVEPERRLVVLVRAKSDERVVVK